MKSQDKSKNTLFVCKECGKSYDRFCELSKHIGLHHNKRDYYDKYLKKEGEGICPICKNETLYLDRWDRGYNKTCSKNCANKLRMQQLEKTCIKKYGVKNAQQDKNIFEKQQHHSYYSKKYKNTNVYYRALYELDFLEKYFNTYSDIQNGPTIKYKFNRKSKIYFPDFYIPSLNLIIECKNSYLAKKDKNIIAAKKKATITNGFNYIMITNKRYNRFEKLVLH
jgi:hypothetical protein